MGEEGEGGGDFPRMVLGVLLVEADDCTRQLIAALLRKCSYRVSAVPDGLKAWETLKESSHNIDLVLTEVELPSISGYGLLTSIVEHDMCKNIPVIMMSSKDSISTVLKCMVKGASDFLIKPIRKNELRNLWQHVWRKKIQDDGSHPQKKALENQRIVEVSGNVTACNCSTDDLASVQRGNDKPCDAHASDGNHEECVEMVRRSFTSKSKQLANMTSPGMGTSSGSVGICSDDDSLYAEARAVVAELQHECHRQNTCTVDEVDFPLNEPHTEAFDYIGKFENFLVDSDGQFHDSEVKSNVASRLGLSLLTFNPGGSNDECSREQNMISHSKASAFSKYENKNTLQPPFSGPISNCAPQKEGSSASTWEQDTSLTENQQNTSSLTYSTSGVQFLEQEFDDSNVHSEDNAAEAENPKLGTTEKARDDAAACESSDFGSDVTNKVNLSRCGSNSNEAIESSFPVASPGRALVSESMNNDDLLNDRKRAENHNTSQREAALIKFRLKRKDRCFDKKVRYQSRKRLAEQRPRVKGQFVRQLQNETRTLKDKDEKQVVHQSES